MSQDSSKITLDRIDELQVKLDEIYDVLDTKLNVSMDNLGGNVATNLNNFGVRTIVDSWVSGTSWYRVYSDGWVEQGGQDIANELTNKNIVLFIPMATETYYASVVNASGKTSGNAEGVVTVGAKYVSSFNVSAGYIDPNTSSVLWEVKGFRQ